MTCPLSRKLKSKYYSRMSSFKLEQFHEKTGENNMGKRCNVHRTSTGEKGIGKRGWANPYLSWLSDLLVDLLNLIVVQRGVVTQGLNNGQLVQLCYRVTLHSASVVRAKGGCHCWVLFHHKEPWSDWV